MKNTIKKEKDLFKRDISEDETTYVYHLIKNKDKIDTLAVSPLPTFKQEVLKIVEPANDTPAKRNFVLTLNQQRNTMSALQFVYNVILRGQGLEVI